MLKLKNFRQNYISKICLLLTIAAASFFISSPALAASAGDICSTPGATDGSLTCGNCSSQGCVWSGPANSCDNTLGSNGKVNQSKVNKCLNQSPVVKDIQNIVNFLSAGVGIIVIGVIILGGIQYSMAGDNANATGAAKTRITNGLLALFAFIFAWAFLQWLIPGGIFG
ncbi:MAG TPA: hypothetical protein VFJ84_03305 [Candidatus Saccharimonadales bacterium]|nr:hypothetical protein [Candidatus Saccharimonadales bacterium]